MTSDLTFFTNEPDEALLDRFKATLNHIQYFDVLVGYFRTSGFHLLYESFEQIEKIRILVGLNVDRKTFEIIDQAQGQLHLNFESHQQTQQAFSNGLVREMEHSPDTYDTETGVKKFVEFIQSGKLEIKAHPSQNIHAKVYISRFPEGHYDYGRVITGSSNFSQSGLVGNYEFNVELKNSSDVKYALDKFEALWLDAVDISEAYIDTINKRTWLNDQISPYELYLKFLYEYFKEEINIDQDIDVHLPPGFLELEYQKQATVSARKILDSYNGVFLADVVGLGKTFISALLAQQLPGKKLVICPPVLKEYWEKTFFQFNVSVVVESMGKLDHIIRKNPDRFDYVFVDEAHRFRNEVTQSYEKLHRICWGKKVILVSATPLNNTIEDIYSQLKLFQAPKKSLIPGVSNLEKFFAARRKYLKQFDKGTPEYLEAVKDVAQEVRNQILKHVMVRRTRKEIVNFFSEDMSKRGLSFPELTDPERIIYTFDPQTDAVFNQTIQLLQQFSYSRYTPLLYLKKGLSEFEAQSQRNAGGFMKGTLVKRLESSFFAFKRSLGRFIESYERFIEMYHQGTIYISKHVNVYDLLDADDEARLLELVEEEKAQKYQASVFRPDFLNDLQQDLQVLKQIQSLWVDIEQDPKLDQFIADLRRNKLLKRKKVIVFTESAETGSYLYQKLDEQFPNKVMFYSSGGGQFQERGVSKALARELIEANYDPNYHSSAAGVEAGGLGGVPPTSIPGGGNKAPRNDIRILISTDVLAEGINLHRSNIVINYDLPWNPTRVLQRVGRVNLVGTEHQLIFIFNFFPTAQSDRQLGLEDNIKAKIQAFHDMLGEDAKYLTDEEDVSQFELFGDRLYRKLTSKKSFEGEEEESRSELEFLRLIQDIRDSAPALFEKIKRLPRKARTGRQVDATDFVTPTHPPPTPSSRGGRAFELPPVHGGIEGGSDSLLSFFRQGKLKKFFITAGDAPTELAFLDAVDLLQCAPDTPRRFIPKTYYDLLALNKEQFALATSPAAQEKGQVGGGQSNEQFIIRLLKSREIKRFKGFTDDNESYLAAVLDALQAGIIPRNTAKRLRNELNAEMKSGFSPLKLLHLLKKNIPDAILYTPTDPQQANASAAKREVILSEYLII